MAAVEQRAHEAPEQALVARQRREQRKRQHARRQYRVEARLDLWRERRLRGGDAGS
jgi:hypothetical protein